jgi:7 transmembrane sweet-taste receptor of 3 GCPR
LYSVTDRIVNVRGLKRMKITNNYIAIVGVCMSFAMCVYLAFLSGFGRPTTSLRILTEDNQDTYVYSCELKEPGVHLALFIVEIVIIVWGIRLCFSTKDAPSAVNESKFIALATAVIIGISILVLPIVYFLSLSPVATETIAGLAFSICQFATLVILFLPKVLSLFNGDEVDTKLKVQASSPKILGEQTSSSNVLLKACHEALMGKSLDEKYVVVQEQLHYWKTMLVVIEEKRSSETRSSGNEPEEGVSKLSETVYAAPDGPMVHDNEP